MKWLLPTEDHVRPFLAACLLRGEVRDVRKMQAANEDEVLDRERLARLAAAKQRSRAKIGRRGW